MLWAQYFHSLPLYWCNPLKLVSAVESLTCHLVTDSSIMLIHSCENLCSPSPYTVVLTTFNFLWRLRSTYRELALEGNLDTPTAVANVFIPLATVLIESDCRWSEVWSDCSSESKCSLRVKVSRLSWQGSGRVKQRSPHRDFDKPIDVT